VILALKGWSNWQEVLHYTSFNIQIKSISIAVPILHLGTVDQKTSPTAVPIRVCILRISSIIPIQTLDPGIG
jgi:hypothetical protein